MNTRWERINAIFDHAVELAAAERAAYLDSVCSDDAALRAEVARLVDAHERASGFIERPLDRALANAAHARVSGLEGKQIGAWRVLREIGRGGMGTVWLGERTDGQFEQHVAIKLMQPGLGADWVLRRFRTERRILAGLDHPHIARLYDGGTTDDGVPYFVMEYIEGVPIDRYCDENGLNVSQRLELFRQVCAAVAYAHQSLVVHRDIKPSNVLVAADGAAKLLDFGIATILEDRGTNAELHTATVRQLMTPEYASPEQIRGQSASTLSDVYALGVMLYELLCGRPPRRFANRSLAEVARALSEGEPERPSTATTTPHGATRESALDAESQRLASLREGSVERLRRRLRGDLDTIVLKAMQSDPQRRYASVEQFSEDIRRHLAGLPVVARPDTVGYRARKFVRRNRIAVAGATLVALALVGGAVTTAWQARRARDAQARAERRFTDLRKLARSVLFDYHDAIQSLPGSTPVRERLVTDGLEYLDGLAREAAGDASLQRELADAYLRMGDVQGGVASNLGNTAGAIESYRKAEAIYRVLVGADSALAENRRGHSRSLVKLCRIIWQHGSAREALDLARSARESVEWLAGAAPEDDATRRDLISALDAEGLLLIENGDVPAALATHERQLAECERVRAAQPADPAARRNVAVAHARVGKALVAMGEYDEALPPYGESLRLRFDLAAEFPMNTESQRSLSVAYSQEAGVLAVLGRIEAALANYERSFAIVETLLAGDPKNEQYQSDKGHALAKLGDTLVGLERLHEAQSRYRAALEVRSAVFETDPGNEFKKQPVIDARAKLAKVLARLGDASGAREQIDAALALLHSTVPESTNVGLHSVMAERYADLGAAHAFTAEVGSGPSDARREDWRRALEMFRRSGAIWTDLRDRGVLAGSDLVQLEAVSREIARCEAEAGS
ncbi:MAG: protein kinase domain-containing protein [bacterium]